MLATITFYTSKTGTTMDRAITCACVKVKEIIDHVKSISNAYANPLLNSINNKLDNSEPSCFHFPYTYKYCFHNRTILVQHISAPVCQTSSQQKHVTPVLIAVTCEYLFARKRKCPLCSVNLHEARQQWTLLTKLDSQ